jgi:drug/metabolite transporter (DMT)-like permease
MYLCDLKTSIGGMTDKTRSYIQLHFCVLIWGFTAVLGALISLQALSLVWWRVSLCCLGLLFLVPMREIKQLSRPVLKRLFGIGLLVGLHWLCFYGAIKLANASVAVVTMAIVSFFSSILEPLMLKQKTRWYEVIIGLVILPGIWLCLENIDLSQKTGFFVGILSAFLAALFSILNKKVIESAAPPALVMTLVELFAIVVLTSILLLFFSFRTENTVFLPQGNDWIWLMVLAWGCTLLPFALSLKAMKHLSAFSTNLTINLEPVYGVLLAGFFLNEHQQLPNNFYWGVFIIMIAVFSHPVLKNYFDKKALRLQNQPIS